MRGPDAPGLPALETSVRQLWLRLFHALRFLAREIRGAGLPLRIERVERLLKTPSCPKTNSTLRLALQVGRWSDT